MTQANNALTYCAGCGRLIPGKELQAGLSEAREAGVVCISCIERSDPRRAAEIREMSFREAERAKVSVQLMWAPPGVIPPRAARLAGEGASSMAPGAVDPISGDVGEEPLDVSNPATATSTATTSRGGLLMQGSSTRRVPWWIVGVASLLMGVVGAVTQRLVMAKTTTPPASTSAQPAGNPAKPLTTADLPQPEASQPRTTELTPPPERPTPPPQNPPPPGPTPASTPTPPTPTTPTTTPAPASPVPPAPSTQEDENRARALLDSADADFDRAPDRAEKLYATILDFYPTTAAATMARLRAGDLTIARDRNDVTQLQATFDKAMAQARYETYTDAAAGLTRIQTTTPHGATSKALQEKLAAALQAKLDLLKGDLLARSPLIIGEAINNGELPRAAAIVKTLDLFGDATSHATALAMQSKIDAALAADAFRKQAPGLRAQVATAPYMHSFDARLVKWDFAGATRELMPAGSDDLWKNAGAGVPLQMQVLTVYFQSKFRDALLKCAQSAIRTKPDLALDWSPARIEYTASQTGSSRNRDLHSGTWVRVSTDTLTVLESGHEVRVDWSRLSADSLARIIEAANQPPDATPAGTPAAIPASTPADDDPNAAADLQAALRVLALARGETTPADVPTSREPWNTFFELRRAIEADQQGETLALDLRRDFEAANLNALLYDLRAAQTLATRYPTPLAFLAPDGRALLADAQKYVADHNGGTLVFYQDYRQPDGLWKGLTFEALPMRADQRPPQGQMLIGAKGGTQRVLVRFQDIKVPTGTTVKKAYLRIPLLSAASLKTDGKPLVLDDIAGLVPLSRPFNPGHVTWDFTDTLHSTRWNTPGAYESDGPDAMPGKRVKTDNGDDLLFDITPYFDSLAKADYADAGYGLVLKVLKNEPDYTLIMPDPLSAVLANQPAPSLELQLVPKLK